DRARSLTLDNPAQQADLAALAPVNDQVTDLLHRVFELHDQGKSGPDALKSLTEEGKPIGAALSKTFGAATAEENHLLEQRTNDAAVAGRRPRILQTAGGSCALGLLLLLSLLFLRENSFRENAIGQLEDLNVGLEHRVVERTAELQTALVQVKRENGERIAAE